MAGDFVPYPRYIFRKRIALGLLQSHVPAGSRFLEVGCASGDFGFALERLGYRGTLIDYSDEAAASVREQLRRGRHDGIEFRHTDLFNLDAGDRLYDFVTAFEVLEHIEDDHAAARKMSSLVRNGGWVLVSVPSRKRLWSVSDVAAGHYRRYEHKELRQLLEDAGLSVAELYSYGFPFLNVLKVVRDAVFARKLKGELGSMDLRGRTAASGLHQKRLAVLGWASNEALWTPFIKVSTLFNRFDLAEGYLCLARKKP